MPFTLIPNTAALARAIVDTVRDPLLVLDHDLRIVAASRADIQIKTDQGVLKVKA
jgi:hypothetical protein